MQPDDNIDTLKLTAYLETLKNQIKVEVLGSVFPVGSIYENKTDPTNPEQLFGFGTWVAIAGRVVVGLDPAQTEFDTAGETGGAKTHTLTTSEIPSHAHSQRNGSNGDYWGLVGGGGGGWGVAGASTNNNIYRLNTGNAGGGGSHNNLQPYVVAYMWERTA